MLRRFTNLLGTVKYFYAVGATKPLTQNEIDVSRLESISKTPFYISFKDGLNLTMNNQFQEANQKYQKALTQISQRNDPSFEHYVYILKKIALNIYKMGRMKAVEENIYRIIKHKRSKFESQMLIFEDFNNLIIHYMGYDAQKAVLLGKALLTEKQKANMSLVSQKMFMFHLGNAYLLTGNYEDAKKRYSECLNNEPLPQLKSMVLNNLAIACWWHKNPLFSGPVIPTSPQKIDSINNDYKQTRQILLKAIEVSENVEMIPDEEKKYRLKQALSEEEFTDKLQFRSIGSLKPMYNLAQFYINNDPLQKLKIMFWLQSAMKLSKRHQQNQIFDQIYVTIFLLSNEKEQLAKVVPRLVEKFQGKKQNHFFQKIYAFLKMSEGKAEEAAKINSDISKRQNEFLEKDPNIFKKKYLAEYNLNLN